MSGPSLRDSQLAMAGYLRDPAATPPPRGVEQRRLDIYQRLVYNNIEGFISKGFPVLRSLYGDDDWQQLVRGFIQAHRCSTPYFMEISQEFLQYLLQEYQLRDLDPPFMAELAHYEWVELALDVAEESPPPAVQVDDPLAAVPRLSPLAWLLSYRFPVHQIGPRNQPREEGEPTYLVVYRDREERVRFMELNAVTARLVELTRGNSEATGAGLLATLAAETRLESQSLQTFGSQLLARLLECGVLGVSGRPPCEQS
ncbi:MAG: putative DNA-binding domain-containing protein [Halieaceae bacterium]|nr:putative DNA-binding domain-containing protein [Halieaceae bacterium]MCP5148250.1 putative DNA-binding domain-containing protein [Pseudomonadales bacterium]MCP5188247.1 putative DNA-binding domain-containing protein [Pseudomonadales bacterium]